MSRSRMIARVLASLGALLHRHRYRRSTVAQAHEYHTCAHEADVVQNIFEFLQEIFLKDLYKVRTVTFLGSGVVQYFSL